MRRFRVFRMGRPDGCQAFGGMPGPLSSMTQRRVPVASVASWMFRKGSDAVAACSKAFEIRFWNTCSTTASGSSEGESLAIVGNAREERQQAQKSINQQRIGFCFPGQVFGIVFRQLQGSPVCMCNIPDKAWWFGCGYESLKAITNRAPPPGLSSTRMSAPYSFRFCFNKDNPISCPPPLPFVRFP